MMRTLWIGLAGMVAGALFAWALPRTPDTRVSGMSEVSPEESASVHSAVVAHEEFERLRAELIHQATLPNQGPLLRLEATDFSWAITELHAAIQAMSEPAG